MGEGMMMEMKRLAAYLPDPVYEELEKWATDEKRSLSNLVGYLLEAAVRERQKSKSEVEPTTEK
ncbi:ribbon-helix-helix domain-containing protein [Leptolyngbya sp. AN02str]|uniref:ribbon-helix-helix domain-containing protein n=1 Tax=Leptolyngbya sp. AN02str TaxID=3423363 RepID=UPI003D31CA37